MGKADDKPRVPRRPDANGGSAVAEEIHTGIFQQLLQPRDADAGVTAAIVEDISPDGVAMVVLSGDTKACEASTILHFASAAAAADALLGRPVLVLVNRGMPPVILGVIAQKLFDRREAEAPREVEVTLPVEGRSVQLDKRKVDLEASEEIRLTCGKSSLVMRRDGTVIIRGVRITSRASQANKVRGATVSIN
jgi:hypothetical protein